MGITIANCHGSSFGVAKSKWDWLEVKKNAKFFTSLTKEDQTQKRK